MTVFTVFEWEKITVHNAAGLPAPNSLTRRQADALIAAAKAHDMGGDGGVGILSDHHHYLQTHNMVGILATDDCVLEILPKIERHNDHASFEEPVNVRRHFAAILDKLWNLNLSLGHAANIAQQNHTILDVFIQHFATLVAAQIRLGMPRHYLQHEEDIPALRGSLNTTRQFTTLLGKPSLLACRFDELSNNIILMQIVKACVQFLMVFARHHDVKRQLQQLNVRMAEIDRIDPRAIDWSSVNLDRTTRNWQPIIAMARMFLEKNWQDLRHSAKEKPCLTLLFSMPVLFEKYVALLLKRYCRSNPQYARDYHVVEQGGGKYCLIDGNNHRVGKIRPDIILKHGSQTDLIIDTKWKIHNDTGAHNVSDSDIYQMMVYAQLYQCEHVVLLYPFHQNIRDENKPRRYKIMQSQSHLSLATINIAQKPELVQAQLGNLLEKLNENPSRTADMTLM